MSSGTVFYTPVVVKPLPWHRPICLVRRIFLPHFVQITILVEVHVVGTVLTVDISHRESVHVPVSIADNVNHTVGRIALDSCAANAMQKGVERRSAVFAQSGYKQGICLALEQREAFFSCYGIVNGGSIRRIADKTISGGTADNRHDTVKIRAMGTKILLQPFVRRRRGIVASGTKHGKNRRHRQAPFPLPKYVRDYTNHPAVCRLNMQN